MLIFFHGSTTAMSLNKFIKNDELMLCSMLALCSYDISSGLSCIPYFGSYKV